MYFCFFLFLLQHLPQKIFRPRPSSELHKEFSKNTLKKKFARRFAPREKNGFNGFTKKNSRGASRRAKTKGFKGFKRRAKTEGLKGFTKLFRAACFNHRF